LYNEARKNIIAVDHPNPNKNDLEVLFLNETAMPFRIAVRLEKCKKIITRSALAT